MKWEIVHIDETESTNKWVKVHKDDASLRMERAGKDALCVVADYQTAGRGCGTNRWEGERGRNLLFSLLIRPHGLSANRQFHLSMAISLAISETLGQHVGDVSIKWPNDIYWRDGKIAGILIEHTLQGALIKDSIIGVGLNVNQREFRSDAPNPVSLWQISGQETNREELLGDILRHFDELLADDVRSRYLSRLYRRKGYHPYADRQGAFMAEIADVEDDGHLLLNDDNGQQRRYAFKEVSFVI